MYLSHGEFQPCITFVAHDQKGPNIQERNVLEFPANNIFSLQNKFRFCILRCKVPTGSDASQQREVNNRIIIGLILLSIFIKTRWHPMGFYDVLAVV